MSSTAPHGPAFTLRAGLPYDADALAVIEQRCFAHPWTRGSLLRDLAENPLARYLVAEADGAVVGYAGLWLAAGEGNINNVAVLPEYRRRGIADSMLSSLITACEMEGAEAFTLEVRASNDAAIALYLRHGFAPEGVRKAYYEDNGEDAIIMWRRRKEETTE